MPFTIRQARMLNGITQAEMARKMGISRDTYRKIELNPEKTTIKQAKDISEITGVGIDQIFFTELST